MKTKEKEKKKKEEKTKRETRKKLSKPNNFPRAHGIIWLISNS
jgi:hypothetical protein